MMKCVLWLNGIMVVDEGKPPIRRGHVLGKLITASVTHIERLISLGVVYSEIGRTLGSMGIIRVIDVNSNSGSTCIGKYYLVLPRPDSIGGIHFDGVLANYPVLPIDSLIPLAEHYALRPETILYAELSYIHDLTKYVRNKEVLVVGCGPSSYLVCNHIRDLCNVYVACLSYNNMISKIAELGVYVANIDNLSKLAYDVVVFLSISGYFLNRVVKYINNKGLILLPPTIPGDLVSIVNYELHAKRVKILPLKYGSIDSGIKAIGKHLDKIKRLISITNDFNDLINNMHYFWRALIHNKHSSKS